MSEITDRLGPGALVILGLSWVVARLVVYRFRGDRFFALDQERLVARAVGPGCTWQRTRGIPTALGTYLVVVERYSTTRLTITDRTFAAVPWIGERLPAFTSPAITDETLWITGLVLLGAGMVGLPLIRTTSFVCSGPIVRAHQVAAAHGGTTSIFNLELACFPAGTVVPTSRGFVPIETIKVGDEVVTHLGRLRPVTATTSRTAPLVKVGGSGNAAVVCTPDHRFLARPCAPLRNRTGHLARVELGNLSWTPAASLEGSWWSYLPGLTDKVPAPATPFDPDDLLAWWTVGRWLGDGWLHRASDTVVPSVHRMGPYLREPGPCAECPEPRRLTRKGVGVWSRWCSDRCRLKSSTDRKRARGYTGPSSWSICCGHHETDRLAAVLGSGWTRTDRPTATVFSRFTDPAMVAWLDDNFGHGATSKSLPLWALSLPEDARRSLLDGYVSADGHVKNRTDRPVHTRTVSKRLAVGTKMLADSLGYHAHISAPSAGGPSTIAGRAVTTRPAWNVLWTTDRTKAPKAKTIDGMVHAPVRSVTDLGTTAEVFCLTVAEDESYVADGVVVHNCERHNASQSATWSWWWAARQYPWTLPIYAVRSWWLTIRIVWLLLTDSRARRGAR